MDSLALEGLSLSENDNEEKEGEKEEMVGLGGGPILTRGIKFASSDEFLSFMETEGERSENELETSPTIVGVSRHLRDF